MGDNYDVLNAAVRDTYARVAWSHKIQEKQCDIYSNRYKVMETLNIIAAASTSAGVVSLLFVDELWVKLISALLSFVTLFVSAYFKSFDLQTMMGQHKLSANELLSIRNRLEIVLLHIEIKDTELSDLTGKYEKIIQDLDEIYKSAPNTTDRAVALARKALDVQEDNTFSDDEIDRLLPEKFRRGKN